MQNTFTQDDFIHYFYGEMEESKKQQFLQYINTDPQLLQDFNEMKQSIEFLDGAKINASNSSIDLIMEYSASTSAHPEYR